MKAKKVNELLGNDILRPKSDAEIRQASLSMIQTLENIQSAKDYEEEDTANELKRIADAMNSDVNDLKFIVEEEEGYEQVESIVRRISAAHRPIQYVKIEGIDLNFSIRPDIKIAFGNNKDFDGLNMILFDYPHLVSLIEQWEKLPT